MSACLKYRADRSRANSDGSISWFADWMGGPSLSKIENCRWPIAGSPRVTVFITGEPDSFFSQPAAINYRGVTVRGFVSTGDDGNLQFNHQYF